MIKHKILTLYVTIVSLFKTTDFWCVFLSLILMILFYCTNLQKTISEISGTLTYLTSMSVVLGAMVSISSYSPRDSCTLPE